MSDCGAIHNVTKSLEAGCDISCESEFSQSVPQLVKDGSLQVSTINTAVSRLLYVRMRLGEWDAPSTVPFRDEAVYVNRFILDVS